MISSTHRPTHQQTYRPTPSEEQGKPAPTYFDNFKATASSEVPRAMTYSAVAGAALGLATGLLGGSPFSSVAQTVAIAAAGGAGIGLASGLLVSAFSTESPSVAPTPQPKEPVREEPIVPKPVITPEAAFAKDMAVSKSILDRRLDALESLLQAEQNRHDSLGRSGLKAFDQARELFSVAKKDLQEHSQQRPSIVGLEKELDSVKARLRQVRGDQQRVLGIQNRSDKLGRDSLNRSGRYSRDGAQEVTRELQAEAGRLEQAIALSKSL